MNQVSPFKKKRLQRNFNLYVEEQVSDFTEIWDENYVDEDISLNEMPFLLE